MKLKILLIEDDLDDVELLQDALKKQNVLYDMESITDGNTALEFIRNPASVPDIVILDMNLPRVDGRILIPEIKSSPLLKDIPLLILTTSSAIADVEYAYKHGANRYMNKPVSVDGIRQTIEIIVELAIK